jgi:hypothetical protein
MNENNIVLNTVGYYSDLNDESGRRFIEQMAHNSNSHGG